MSTLRFPLLLASFLLVACGNVVIGGGGPGATSSAGGTGGGGSTAPGTGAPTLPAVALTRAQNDILWDEYWSTHDPSGTTTSSGGGNLDPNDLFLHLSDVGVSCGSPSVDLPCGGHYEMTLVLPPSLQQVGIYPFDNPELVKYSGIWETGDLYSSDPEDCSSGGGSLFGGSLEILSIDPTEVHFKVTSTSGVSDTNPSGEYTAPRCP